MAMDDIKKLAHTLSKIPLFYGLSDEELENVLGICKPDAFEDDDIIFNENDPSHSMYIILSGEVDITSFKAGLIYTLKSCDIFGEIGLITQQTRSASAIAQSSCKLLRIDHTDFTFLLGKHPRISAILMKNISSNLANHLIRMNNVSLEYVPQTDKNEIPTDSQVLSNSPK
ncbi:MAG: cyclic nucleotide-binding domain-containing protein [Gammaproteobacteria bacterium]|nr:cyclic nucleotide-binding domain-containing protein [Gammaproteobacteria bacterium]MCW9004730.1 cyclic nucleotide-binding domain-containing protein [Gammaproteobacteria bacterium]